MEKSGSTGVATRRTRPNRIVRANNAVVEHVRAHDPIRRRQSGRKRPEPSNLSWVLLVSSSPVKLRQMSSAANHANHDPSNLTTLLRWVSVAPFLCVRPFSRWPP
jgi:hypothetical protein